MIELGADVNFATIGNAILAREEGEPVPTFRMRAREVALAIGAGLLVFGLLEPMIWVDDLDPQPAADLEGGRNFTLSSQ